MWEANIAESDRWFATFVECAAANSNSSKREAQSCVCVSVVYLKKMESQDYVLDRGESHRSIASRNPSYAVAIDFPHR